MKIAEILDLERVRVDVDAKSKKRVLETLSELFAASVPELCSRHVFEQLFGRERLGSTGLGDGVGLPHGRIDNLDRAMGCFIRLREPIGYEAIDDRRVDLVFGLIVPTDCTDEHLEILAELAGGLSDPETRDALRTADASHGVFDLLASMSSPTE